MERAVEGATAEASNLYFVGVPEDGQHVQGGGGLGRRAHKPPIRPTQPS